MNYKQSLLFVAKCLTLDLHPEKAEELKNEINSDCVDWEKVVKLSSGQLVMPAMYLQIKRNGLLTELPSELAEYLEEITDLNRERNKAILQQAQKISSILNAHNISPLFLKGVAHLYAGLYTDIAERMIGDIDFLVPEDKMVEAAELLIKEGYKPLIKYTPEMFRELKHYPRMQNFSYPAAVEIHKEVVQPENKNLLRGDVMFQNKQPIGRLQNQAFIPSASNMLVHNVYNIQLTDSSFRYGDIALRQMYDLLLLAKKENILDVARKHEKKFKLFNTYFAAIAFAFSNPKGIKYENNWQTRLFLKRINLFLQNQTIYKLNRTVFYLLPRISRYITLPIRSIYQKDTRKRLFARITRRSWYVEHIKSYGKFFKR